MDNMGIDLGFDYGTPEYNKAYVTHFYDTIKFIKLDNGDVLIGFYTEGIYINDVHLDFPMAIRLDEQTTVFELGEYTPELKLRTIQFDKRKILFKTTPGENLINFYCELVMSLNNETIDLTDHLPSENDVIH